VGFFFYPFFHESFLRAHVTLTFVFLIKKFFKKFFNKILSLSGSKKELLLAKILEKLLKGRHRHQHAFMNDH